MDYFNDPELNGKYLGTITKDFVAVCDTLFGTAHGVTRVQPVNMFPHTHHVENVVLLELR